MVDTKQIYPIMEEAPNHSKKEEEDLVSNKRGPKRRKNVFGLEINTEIRHIFELGWPTVLANICQLVMTTQCIIFSGSLGKTELAVAALSNAIYIVFGLSVALGLSSALETLCAQAFGAKNFRMVGVVLQRGICIFSIVMFIVWGLWMLTQHFLLLIGIESRLAKMTDLYIMILLPILPACFGTQLVTKYLQTQKIVRPIVVVGLLTNISQLSLNFLMIKALNQGIKSVAIVFVIANYIQLCLLIFYIKFWKVYERTWEGWSKECLYDWKMFITLAVPGMLMVCMEWWTFKLTAFVMGQFGESIVAANGVILQITGISFMIPYGISVAAGVLVGNYLGANQALKAKLVTKLSVVMTIFCTLVYIIIVLCSKKYIAMAFSDNESVVELISLSIPYMILVPFMDSLQGVCAGIFRGCGQQKLGMIINFISYDIVAIPLSIILAFMANMHLKGMWLGISVGISVQALLYLTILACTNWNRQAELARKRTSRNYNHEHTVLNHHELLPIDCKQTAISDININDQHTAIPDIDDQYLNKQENGDDCFLEKPDADYQPNPLISKPISVQDLEILHQSLSEEKFGSSNTRRQDVNMKKLIILRSIPYIIGLIVLCSTIFFRLFVPLPEAQGNYVNNTSSNQNNNSLT